MNRIRIAVTVWVVVIGFAGAGTAQTDLTPQDIIERVDRVMRGDSSHGVSRMHIVTEHWERELEMEMWSMGTDYSLVRVRAPAKEAGTATLMADKDIWNYLPKVDRTIKIPASMMSGTWMGSHFTNDDLVKESQLIEDFDIELTFEGARDDISVWEFRLTPRPEVAVVWGHIDYRVRQSDYMPLWARYYNEDGELARTMNFSEFKNLDGRTVPTVMDMVPADKPDERTSVIYESLEFDIDVDQSFFSLQTLKRRR
jgi:hypothetical protein